MFWTVAIQLAQDPVRVRLDVRLVHVVATVTDANGKFVSNLQAEDFSLEDNGVPQKLVHFSQDSQVPVTVGILLDTSGSMDRKIRTATTAVNRFINGIHPEDEIFLMTFDRRVTLQEDFTSDRKKLARVLDTLRLGGGTRLYDGLQEGLEKIQKGRHDKKALLMISDGMDYGSRTSVGSLVQTIRGVEVLVYGLGTAEMTYADPVEHVPFTLPTPGGRGPAPVVNAPPRPPNRRGATANALSGVNMSVLTQFAENSGGHAFRLTDTFLKEGPSEIDKVLSLIAEELRHQYTLGYYPTHPDDGRVHTIKVTARGGHAVRSRTSYLAR
jgi:VWFA-related protein